jgi:hypothetical protein
MTECIICWEDLNDKNRVINIFMENDKEIRVDSKVCANCVLQRQNNILSDLLSLIADETCEASIKRICKAKLPKYLTLEYNGSGKKIDKMFINGHYHDTKLISNLTLEEIDEINNSMQRISDLAKDDNSLFLYEKEETFKKYKKV